MMTLIEICKHALENLKAIELRQEQLFAQDLRPERRAKYHSTRQKIAWLEKVIETWEGGR